MTLNVSNKLEIKQLNKKEANQTIAKKLFDVAEAGFQNQSPWSLDQIRATLDTPNTLIIYAHLDEEIVGFMMASEDMEMVDIFMVVVAEPYKQQGVGTKLFEYLMDYSEKKNLQEIILETRKSNEPAIKLYERMGFKKVGLRRGYYSSPIEDAIVMKREL